jgi:hypothetical protein
MHDSLDLMQKFGDVQQRKIDVLVKSRMSPMDAFDWGDLKQQILVRV